MDHIKVKRRFYDNVNTVGLGQFGVVFEYWLNERHHGKNLPTVIAVKRIDTVVNSPPGKYLEREITILKKLSRLRNHNIVQFYGVEEIERKVYMFMEFCDCNLNTYLSEVFKANQQGLDVSTIIFFSVQLAKAVEFLHRKKIMHRDLKCKNVLVIRSAKILKVCDFGLSRIMETDRAQTLSSLGTAAYMAPEIHRVVQRGVTDFARYTYLADVFSLGVIYFEIALMEPPFGEQELKRGDPPLRDPTDQIRGVSEELALLIKSMLAWKSQNRPEACDIVQTLGTFCCLDSIEQDFKVAENILLKDKRVGQEYRELLYIRSLKVQEATASRSTRYAGGKEECLPDQMTMDILKLLKLKKYYPEKISLDHVRRHFVGKVRKTKDMPMFLLHKILSLDYWFVVNNFFPKTKHRETPSHTIASIFNRSAPSVSNFQQIEVIVTLFLSSSPQLCSVVAEKLFTCQLSIPLILPDANRKLLIMLLGALRNITINNNIGREVSLVDHKCSIVSFVCLGNDEPVFGEIINATIKKAARNTHNMFHNIVKKGSKPSLANGLIDMAWYLPSENELNLLDDITLFLYLRGNTRESKMQLNILQNLSSMVILLITEESFSKLNRQSKDMEVIVHFCNSDLQIALLVFDKDKEIQSGNPIFESPINILKKLGHFSHGNLSCPEDEDEASTQVIEMIKKLPMKKKSLADFADFACEHKWKPDGCSMSFQVDEDSQDGFDGQQLAIELLRCVKLTTCTDLVDLKQSALPIQMLSQEWVKLNKCRIRDIGKSSTKNIDAFLGDLENRMREIEKIQREKSLDLSPLMTVFLKQLTDYYHFDVSENSIIFMLNYLKQKLDGISRYSLPEMHSEYRRAWANLQAIMYASTATMSHEQILEQQHLITLFEKDCREKEGMLAAASLGLEHVIREMGQIYEAMCNEETTNMKVNVSALPCIMADLLLTGQHFEIIDGDAAYIPLKWVCAVLDKVQERIGPSKKIFVLSILGLQSSGKSTLLNAMFGLQFPVSAGRCTRGVFGQLIPACKKITPNIDYIFVLDTEGLRAPESGGDRAKLQHDHEIATFVVGIGDMTIINLKGELASDMIDVLHIVVHAFLRISQVEPTLKLQSSCVFVHQNVCAASANDKSFQMRRKFQEALDEMTRSAARHEKIYTVNKFSDVIGLDLTTQVKLFTDLWQGEPPMAPVNSGYSKCVQELKKLIWENINLKQGKSMLEIGRKMHNLWTCVLKENFIFHFKNTVEILAYTALEKQLSHIKWKLQDKALELTNKAKNSIKSSNLNTLHNCLEEKVGNIKKALEFVHLSEMELLNAFFTDSAEREVLGQWKERSIKNCELDLKELIITCKEDLQKSIHIQSTEIRKEIDVKIYKEQLLQNAKALATELQPEVLHNGQLDEKFHGMWMEYIEDNVAPIQDESDITYISAKIRQLLYDTLPSDHHHLLDFKLFHSPPESLQIDPHCIKGKKKDAHWINSIREYFPIYTQPEDITIEMNKLFNDIEAKLQSYEGPFDTTRARQLLELLDEGMTNINKRIRLTKEFQVKMNLLLASYMVPQFQKFHDRYQNSIDPRRRLKDTYYDNFLNMFKHTFGKNLKDYSVPKAFWQCLIPKLKQAVANEMPRLLTEHILKRLTYFGTKKELQKKILVELLKDDDFNLFYDHIILIRKSSDFYIRKFVDKELLSLGDDAEPSDGTTTIYATIEYLQVNRIAKNMAIILASAVNTQSFPEFIAFIQQEVNGILPLPSNSFAALEGMSEADFQRFIIYLRESAPDLKTILIAEARKVPTVYEAEGKSVYELLLEKCLGCTEHCPFCKVQCSLTLANHEVAHGSAQHMCQGIGNYRHYDGEIPHKERQLVVGNCSTFVASDALFRCKETNKEFHKYKEYKAIYPKWDIPSDDNYQTSHYWKYVYARFSKKFAEVYEAGEPDIPEQWHKITEKEAIHSLDHA